MHTVVNKQKVYRLIDANFNRAKEGLRVCEDICRFVHNRKRNTATCKLMRHRLSTIYGQLNTHALLQSRDIRQDVGRSSSSTEFKRKTCDDIFYANAQRVKESIRVLEECAKLIDTRLAERFKQLRYAMYQFEKDVMV